MSSALVLANPQAAADGFAWECAYVRGITHDFKVLTSFFADVGIPLNSESCCFGIRKQESCNIIERFFDEKLQAYVLVVASHGAPVAGEIATREGWLRFEDVMRLWLVSGNATDPSKLLFILLDCCHSGFWVTKTARLRIPNVVVQAACFDRGESVGDYDEDCGPDTSFICKWVIEQRWQPSPVLFVLPQDPVAVTAAGLDVERVGWKLRFVTRRKHPLRIIKAMPAKSLGFLRRSLARLDIQAQVRLLIDLAASEHGPAWQWWRFRPVLEELLQTPGKPLMRKENLLADDDVTGGIFQEVRDFMACLQWDDARSCQARHFARLGLDPEMAMPSSDAMAFHVLWHFQHYYVGDFDLALRHLSGCLDTIQHQCFQCESSLKALVFAWMAANWRNKGKAQSQGEDVEHCLREAYRCICKMHEVADVAQLSPLIAAEASLICGCWKADATAMGKAAFVGDLLGKTSDDMQRSLKKEVERGISCCCQASWYDGYLNNMLTLCHIELLQSQAAQDLQRVESLLCSMPFEIASRRTQHKRHMYLTEARIYKLEWEEPKLVDTNAQDAVTLLLGDLDHLAAAFEHHKEMLKCKHLERRLKSVVARRSGA